jgi:hypothetical protein
VEPSVKKVALDAFSASQVANLERRAQAAGVT